MKNKNEVLVKYRIGKDSVVVWCSDSSENNSVATVFNDFLYDFSQAKNVFFHAYRLPPEELSQVVDTGVILEEAKPLLDPFNVFLSLSAAKVNVSCFDRACEATVYYFDNKVRWEDFLATSIIKRPEIYIKEGIMPAYFASVDQGADHWLECGKAYKENVMTLLGTLSGLGCRIKEVTHLSFPYS